jgi:hypothetical protein
MAGISSEYLAALRRNSQLMPIGWLSTVIGMIEFLLWMFPPS